MVSDVVSVGDKIDLIKQINNPDKTVTNKQYVSQVLDFIDNDKAKIAMPIENARIIPLGITDKYTMCFYTSKGLFQCIGEITDRYKEENLYILDVQFLSELEKFQRRQYYRLECILDISYRVIQKEEMIILSKIERDDFEGEGEKEVCLEKLNELQSQWNTGVITDISGGGARFNSNFPHNKGDKIKIHIKLPVVGTYKNFELKANIISSMKLENKSGYCENRVEFSEIETNQREAIIKFVFEEERNIRKREKGLI
jgi:Predicted glycosyltransferase